MKTFTFALLILCAAAATAETIATVKLAPANGWLATLTDGRVLPVFVSPGNRHYEMLEKWIAAGGVVAPADEEPPAVKHAAALELRVSQQLRILALERERDESPEDGSEIQLLIDAARSKLATLRTKP